MRAIIVSAGQGKRLLPLTADTPKCLLGVRGEQSILETQLQTLAECGVTQASVMVGFGAEQVERCIQLGAPSGMEVRTCYNPFFASSDNLITVWLARSEMDGDFLLLNGDTLFQADVLKSVLDSPTAAVTLTINRKADYDDDDMKVTVADDGRLEAVGKKLPRDEVNGESIGFVYFRGEGVEAFRAALDRAVRDAESTGKWYLSVLNTMAHERRIDTHSIEGMWWGEVDSHEDLAGVRKDLSRLAEHEKRDGRDELLSVVKGATR